MTVLKQAHSILQDAKTITSDLYDSLFLQSLLQHGSTSHAKDAHASDTTADNRSEWQQFLDNLCFVCDSKPAGQSVVSIGVEEGSSGAVFWVTTAKRHQEDAERHLKESLRLLAECSLGVLDGNLAMAEITRLSVERSQDRVANYVKRLDRLISEESTRHREEMQPEEGAAILFGIKSVLAERACCHSLCKAAYNFRYSSTYALLKKITGTSTDPFWISVRHMLARLGHWHKTATSLVLHAPMFDPVIRHAIVRSVQPLWYETTRLKLDEDLRALILRVFPTFNGSSMCDFLLEEIQRADCLIKWFRSTGANAKLRTRLHAEVTMLKYFHRESMRFLNDDRYIACSKASCHCCALYFTHHPIGVVKRPSHGNIWVQWAVPTGTEGAAIDDIDIAILRKMANTTRDMTRASLLIGARPRRMFESTIGSTTVKVKSEHPHLN